MSIQQIFGHIGEEVCESYFAENMDYYTRADEYNFLGSSFLKEQVNPKFDISNLEDIAARCRDSGYCGFSPSEMPCKKSCFFEKNYNATSLLNFRDTGDDKYRWYCAIRNTKVELDKYDGSNFSGVDKFVRDYMVCHFFIQNYYYREAENNPYNSMSEAKRKEFHKYWRGYPGRLDYFACSGTNLYCIDSKVNRSRLSLWQQIRMAWMHGQGYRSQIYNVKFKRSDKDELKEVYMNEGVGSAIDMLNPLIQIVDYDPSKYPEAEKMISDRENIFSTARERFVWF